MNSEQTPLRIFVDATNPGQFFACCGILELSSRLWKSALGWFTPSSFHIDAGGSLEDLLSALVAAPLTPLDLGDKTGTRIAIGAPFNFRLDWWHDVRSGGRELKVWAGTMESRRIAAAMQMTIRNRFAEFASDRIFDVGSIAYDAEDPSKKVEPYYFDARRAGNAHSRDVGFSPNDLDLTTTAFPAVELLCLIGLQRCLPAKTKTPRVFDYCTWSQPLPPQLAPVAVNGFLNHAILRRYRFENWYRTGQRKHKAFRSAIPLSK